MSSRVALLKSLRVLYEDNHLLVVDKPPGVATMGVAPDSPTIARAAAEYLKVRYQKPGKVFVGIVSRLDRLVSGVLVLARTSKSASRLSAQFRDHQVTKRYLAGVSGVVADRDRAWIACHDYVVKSEVRQRMETTQSSNRQAQLASLRYRCLAHDARHSLLEVELLTGRKHQIRLQLANLGHPIIGDRKYGSVHTFPTGIALHCHLLRLAHPTQRTRLQFRSLPEHWPANHVNLVRAARGWLEGESLDGSDGTLGS